MPMVSDRVLTFAQDSFRELVTDFLLSDQPARLGLDSVALVARYRRLAVDLGLDLDALVARGPAVRRHRLADIENAQRV